MPLVPTSAARRARGWLGTIGSGVAALALLAGGATVPHAEAAYGPVPVTHYDCPNDFSDLGRYVPYNRYWEQDFVAQGNTITGGWLGIGAHEDGNDHRARIGIYTGSNRTGALAEVVKQVSGYGGLHFTFATPANVSPGQKLYVAATGVGDFTAYDSRAGCFIGRLDGFKPPPPDNQAPTASGLEFSPHSVNVAGGAADISVGVRLQDSVSGVRDASIVFAGPDRGRASAPLVRTSGDVHDGAYTATVKIPKDAEPGTWSARVRASDEAGNSVDPAPLPAGSNTSLSVRSEHADTELPVVQAFDFDPKAIDAGATVRVRLRASDDREIAGPRRLGFTSPGGRLESAAARRESGTSTDAVYVAEIAIPGDAEGGTWRPRILELHDAAGNTLPDGPPPPGMPQELRVTAAPPPPPPPPPPRTFQYAVANVASVNLRAGPGTNFPRVTSLPGGARIDIVCQTVGENINGSVVWDKLNNDTYVSDWYTTTPMVGDYSPPIPRCPGAPETVHPPASAGRWAIAATSPVNLRAGPGTGHRVVGALGPGARFDIACQTYGEFVYGSPIWNRLPDGRYVSDYFANTPVYANFSPGIPVCAGTGPRPSGGGGGGPGGGIPTGGGGGTARASYVALGDSYSSGEGAPDNGPLGFTMGQNCHRSSLAYPVRFARLAGAQLGGNFFACTGHLTGNLLNQQLPMIPGGGARLITLTIGGNDMNFAGIIKDCVLGSCNRTHAGVQSRIAGFRPRLTDVYRRVKAASRGGHVVVVGYPKFFPSPPADPCAHARGISRDEQAWVNDRIMQFAGVARAAAADAGVSFVNPDGRAFIGHDVCAAANWINGIDLQVAGAVRDQYSFHPNAAGHLAIAQGLIAHGIR